MKGGESKWLKQFLAAVVAVATVPVLVRVPVPAALAAS